MNTARRLAGRRQVDQVDGLRERDTTAVHTLDAYRRPRADGGREGISDTATAVGETSR